MSSSSSHAEAPAADHHLDASGRIVLSDEGQAVMQAYETAKAAFEALRPSWAGAYLAGLFVQYPWLQSLRLTLSASAEYDDEGGSYRSISNSAMAVEAVGNAELPADLLDDGRFDECAAIAVIEADLDDNDHALYAALAEGPDDYQDRSLQLDRSALGPLLEHVPISGHLAHRALFSAPDTNAER